MSFVIRRTAARVLCFDPVGRLLLIRSSDPVDRAKPPWWELPGGGVDHGETDEEALLRELSEEAGITDAIIGPCIWTQHAQFTFSGLNFDHHERGHIAHCDGTPDGTRRLEALEALPFEEQRWWAPRHSLAGT